MSRESSTSSPILPPTVRAFVWVTSWPPSTARPSNESVDFHISLIGRRPGDRLRVAYRRGGRSGDAVLELAGRPKPDAIRLAMERIGINVQPLPTDLAHDLGLPRGGGFLVVGVESGGPAARIGMRSRDVLVALGRYHPRTLDELGQLLEHLGADDQITVTYLRVKPPTIVRYQDVLQVR